MTGKLLGVGAIRGEDGARYYYDEGEIKNLKDGQKLEGCEVDFDIKDSKAIAIYITSDSKAESIASQTNQNYSNEVISKELNIGNTKGFIFKGKVSNCKSNSLGSLGLLASSISGNSLTGSMANINLYAIFFDMGNKSFAWGGSNAISNGDELVVYVESTPNGRHKVECLKNITRELFFEKDFRHYKLYIVIFGLITFACLIKIFEYGGWIANLLICVILAFKAVQTKKIKSIFIALCVSVIPFIFLYLLDLATNKSNNIKSFPLVLSFLVGFIASLVAISRLIKTITTIKAINKAVKEYE